MEHKISEKGLLHASQSTNGTSQGSLGYLERETLHASQSINSTGQWREGYKERDYYMLVGLPMRHVHGARDIRKGIITYI